MKASRQDRKTTFSGSYGYNAWLYSDDEYMRRFFRNTSDQSLVFTHENSIQEPASTPVFVDANWVDLRPKEADERWRDVYKGAPFGTSADNHMGRCCVARHGGWTIRTPRELPRRSPMPGSINMGFADGHVGLVPLEHLWKFNWHRDWKPASSPPQ